MKIQPIDFDAPVVKTPAKSRFKWLFERQFMSEKVGVVEPSSICLSKMVRNFMEGNQLSSASSFGLSDFSEDDPDPLLAPNSVEACEILKSLVQCSSVLERNLLADTARIVEKIHKICRNVVTDGLLALGYEASLCRSRWEKSPSCPAAGEYEYIDVIVEGERMIIDVDFRSEFEIARPTKAYKAIVQTLPQIYVGKSDRLQRIVSMVSDAAKQSLKKKGMPVPPWRKPEYLLSKWLSPQTPVGPNSTSRLAFAVRSDAEKMKAMTRKHSGLGFVMDGVPLDFDFRR